MAELSLAQCAQAVGVNRSTILRSIKSGRISGTRNEKGEWSVAASELFRVFPPVADAEATPSALPQVAQTAALEAEIAGLKKLNELLRQECDRWHEQASRLALPAPRRSWALWKRSA